MKITNKKIKRFKPNELNFPKYVIILDFYAIPGRIAKPINKPPISPPMWATASIVPPIENNKPKKTITPIVQVIDDLIWP